MVGTQLSNRLLCSRNYWRKYLNLIVVGIPHATICLANSAATSINQIKYLNYCEKVTEFVICVFSTYFLSHCLIVKNKKWRSKLDPHFGISSAIAGF